MSAWDVYVGCFTQDLWRYYKRPALDPSVASVGIEHFRYDDRNGYLTHVGAKGEFRAVRST